ncbi:MAG: putative porin [Gammaproteobacteria bacterium]
MTMHTPLRARSLLAALSLCAATALPAQANNQALIDLLALLRDKGTLSAQEYAMLVAAAAADAGTPTVATAPSPAPAPAAATSQTAQGPAPKLLASTTQAPTAKDAPTSWTDTIRLKGDIRTRYEYLKDETREGRSRGRLRYRLGAIAQPVARVEVGAGIASGARDQRSTNQSFDDAFSGKDMNLDYAYMQYAHASGLTGVAGKFPFKNYLWTPSDVMWDTDINPEGLSLTYRGQNALGAYFTSAGVWVLEENRGSSDDPYMVYGQLGQGWSVAGWSGTAAVAGYGFMDINFVSDISRHDGRNTDSKLSSVNLALELTHPVGAGELRLLGEFIKNPETTTAQDTAWMLGWRYALGRWNAKYIYADVDVNAVPDFLPDSDRDQGFTGERGHEFELTYEVIKNVTLALDYYHVHDKVLDIDENLMQADVNVKF